MQPSQIAIRSGGLSSDLMLVADGIQLGSFDFRDVFNSRSDILQLSGRLRSLRNFSLSEWRR
jgi:hypothetical protein